MNLIEDLPDDVILTIYTKFLKRYRFCKGQLIKLIDMDKYAFLQNYIGHRISKVNVFSTGDTDNGKKYSITYRVPNLYEIPNRSNLHIDNDMICMEIKEEDNLVHYKVFRFRLKHIDFLNKEKIPSIYYKAGLKEYDWEVISYCYSV
jgi:hypothetical protein